MRFEAVTEVLTRVQLSVHSSILVKDLATAEAIPAQVATAERRGAPAPG
jgi:hypothetical protein